jgi:hypothetical protein
MRGEPADRRAVAAREPHVEAAAIRVVVGVADRKRDPLAIRRHRRIAHALHREHIVDRETLRARGRRCRRQHRDDHHQ